MQNAYVARESRFEIDGPAGLLQLLVNGVESPKGVALICHPHPSYGGTMDNKVVHTLARAFRDEGIVAVRFNFRGVGNSEGSFSDGAGELDDLKAAIDWAQSQGESLPLWLAGFSFGGAVSANLLQSGFEVKASVLVSPAIGKYGSDSKQGLPGPCLLLQGEEDEVLPPEDVYQWAEQFGGPQMSVEKFPETGHFFHGKLVEIKEVVQAFIQAC